PAWAEAKGGARRVARAVMLFVLRRRTPVVQTSIVPTGAGGRGCGRAQQSSAGRTAEAAAACAARRRRRADAARARAPAVGWQAPVREAVAAALKLLLRRRGGFAR